MYILCMIRIYVLRPIRMYVGMYIRIYVYIKSYMLRPNQSAPHVITRSKIKMLFFTSCQRPTRPPPCKAFKNLFSFVFQSLYMGIFLKYFFPHNFTSDVIKNLRPPFQTKQLKDNKYYMSKHLKTAKHVCHVRSRIHVCDMRRRIHV